VNTTDLNRMCLHSMRMLCAWCCYELRRSGLFTVWLKVSSHLSSFNAMVSPALLPHKKSGQTFKKLCNAKMSILRTLRKCGKKPYSVADGKKMFKDKNCPLSPQQAVSVIGIWGLIDSPDPPTPHPSFPPPSTAATQVISRSSLKTIFFSWSEC